MPKKYKGGDICKTIKNKSAKERAKIKAREIVKAVKLARVKPQSLGAATLGGLSATPDDQWTFTLDGHAIDVALYNVSDDGDGGVLAEVYASDAYGNRPFSNPLWVRNPPIMVPDGTFYQELDPYGEMGTFENFKEDPVAALRAVVEDAIMLQP